MRGVDRVGRQLLPGQPPASGESGKPLPAVWDQNSDCIAPHQAAQAQCPQSNDLNRWMWSTRWARPGARAGTMETSRCVLCCALPCFARGQCAVLCFRWLEQQPRKRESSTEQRIDRPLGLASSAVPTHRQQAAALRRQSSPPANTDSPSLPQRTPHLLAPQILERYLTDLKPEELILVRALLPPDCAHWPRIDPAVAPHCCPLLWSSSCLSRYVQSNKITYSTPATLQPRPQPHPSPLTPTPTLQPRT